MKYLIKYFIDFAVLVFLYAFVFFRQVFLNVIMTLPFGFLFPLTRNKRARFGVTVFFCFFMSLGIELLQPCCDRSSDITDLITNVIGGALGYGLYVIFKPVTFWVLKQK